MPARSSSVSLELPFECPLPSGLHARPASLLAEFANQFTSDLDLTNMRTGASANLKSVLAIIAADVKHGDQCVIRISGTDEAEAAQNLRSYIAEIFPSSDVPLSTASSTPEHGALPRSLQTLSEHAKFGTAVSPGIGQGKVVTIGGLRLPTRISEAPASDSVTERQLAERAIEAVRSRIRQKLANPLSATEAAVLNADLAMATDVAFIDKIRSLIEKGRSAGQAVIDAGDHFINLLRHANSEYIQERALDMQEICLQLLEEICGADFQQGDVELQEPSVVVAETLAPQQLLGLNRKLLKGIVLEYAGTTSHAVILAHSLGIPTVVGVKNAPNVLRPGTEVVVDANRGFVLCEVNTRTQRFYSHELQTLRRRKELQARFSKRLATTLDGKTLEIAANVASSQELIPAFEQGADGIGLFRTEALFFGRQTLLSEEEHLAVYAAVAKAAGGKPAILRTLDIGGDKPLPALALPKEDNPFLGCRGVRIYEEHREALRSQLRAMLRATVFGPLQIMLPMVASLNEVLQFKQQFEQLKAELRGEGIAFDENTRLGIMVEVPSAAFAIPVLSKELDFFSIGTNDLAQYFFAADRGNPRVSNVGSVRHPAFLRLLKQIVDDVHRAGKWVGMCGDMGADSRNLALLIGLGLDEISIPASEIPDCKARAGKFSATACKQLLNRAIECRSAAEVDLLIDQATLVERPSELIHRDLMLLNSSSRSKEEAIKEIVDAFYIAGRTEDRQQLEEALWTREAVYSTGLGYGFATPHCQTDAVLADSIALLKLDEPIEWGSVDGKPVQTVLSLAMRKSGASRRHMQVFSKLARRLMDDNFRSHLLGIEDAAEVVRYLKQELHIAS
jgi:phosphoenolpyruvate-protein phosphotransferase